MDSRKWLIRAAAIGVPILIAFIIFTNATFITIDVGERGVLFRKFGGGIQKDQVYRQGFHVVAPWNRMIIYNVRKQEKKEKMNVLSSNGLEIDIDLSVRYRPEASKIGHLHDEIGKGYERQIIVPEIRSATRKVIGQYTPEQLYSGKRDRIQDMIYDLTKKNLEGNHISLDAVLIREVKLPPKIKAAIERKLEQEQESQEYEFRLEKEEKEAQRKKIEAKGIKQFQEIVSEGVSDKLLKWRGIEATKELSKSENSKIVIIGGDDGGLPVILNNN